MNEKSFENLNLSPELARAIAAAGYTEMTGIQSKIIPLIMEGKDVIGQSSTGTGKTAAFGIPAIEMLKDTEGTDPEVLVLCPTRELAMQVSDELRKLCKYKEGVRVVTVYGGQSIDTQIRALKKAQIVVGTPGRLIDHLRRRTLKLSNIKLAVMDEADEMLDMGFLDDIRWILRTIPENRQTVLFSATMPDPILRVTQRFLKNPEHIKGDEGHVAFDLIKQYYCEVPKSKKMHSVKLIFEQQQAKRGLVFCNTKRMVDVLTAELVASGLSAAGLHGDMRQGARTEVMRKFKDGSIALLVATDVAARGIDASGVDVIINYDIPQDVEYYVHRIGRTGRAGHIGTAITIIAGHGELFGLADIEDVTKVPLMAYELNGLEATPEDKHFSNNTAKPGEKMYRSSVPQKSSKPSGSPYMQSSQNALVSFDVGSFHEVTARHIENSIEKYSKLHKEDIGKITIGEKESFVEFAPDVARHVMKTMQDATVNDFVVVLKAADKAGIAAKKPSSGGPGNFSRRRAPFRRNTNGVRGK